MRVLLVCNQGMSTSVLVKNMYKYADEETVIEAKPVTEYADVAGNYDAILIGPQIRYQLSEVEKVAEKNGIKAAVIDAAAYGMLDGKKVLEQASKLIKGE